MSSIGFFLMVNGIYILLAIGSYFAIKSHYARQLDDIALRYKSLEAGYERNLTELEAERARAAQLASDLEAVSARLREREAIYRHLLPAGQLTPLEIIRIKRLASEGDIQAAREYIVQSGVLQDVEEVLVERKKLSKPQLEEIRQLVRRFITSNRQSSPGNGK